MAIESIIFISILITLQIIPAVYTLLFKRNLNEKYNYPLGEMTEAAEVLENYVKIYNPVNLRVNADIPFPAFAEKEFVLINKNKMYEFDLYTTYFMLFQLELSKAKYGFQRQYPVIQNSFFFFQIMFGLLSFAIETEISIYFLWAAIFTQVSILLINTAALNFYNKIFRTTFNVASDLLNLDDVEQARAKALSKELQYKVYEYPLILIKNIFLFFIP